MPPYLVLLPHLLLFFLHYLFKPLPKQILLLPSNLVLSEDGDPHKAFLEAFESQLQLVGAICLHSMLEELNDVVRSLYKGGDDPVLEGEPHELSQVHILLVVVSPV